MGQVPWQWDGVIPTPPFGNRKGPLVSRSLMLIGPHFLPPASLRSSEIPLRGCDLCLEYQGD